MPLVHLFDPTINFECQNETSSGIPSELRHMLLIQRCCHSGLQTLTSNQCDPLGLPDETDVVEIILGIENNIDNLQKSIGPKLSYLNTIRLLHAKLYFQCVHFLYDNMSPERMTGVLSAFSTASALLTILVSHQDSQTVLPYAPRRTSTLIFMTAMVVFRVLNSSYAKLASINREASHILYSAAALSSRQMAVQYKEKDSAIRCSELITDLWKFAENDLELRESPPKMLVKSRLGNSITFDCLILLRRYRVRQNPELQLRGELQTGENSERRHLDGHTIQENGHWANLGTTNQVPPGDVSNSIWGGSSNAMGIEPNQDWDIFNLTWMDTDPIYGG
jgi:hypothetical protein